MSPLAAASKPVAAFITFDTKTAISGREMYESAMVTMKLKGREA